MMSVKSTARVLLSCTFIQYAHTSVDEPFELKLFTNDQNFNIFPLHYKHKHSEEVANAFTIFKLEICFYKCTHTALTGLFSTSLVSPDSVSPT